MGGQEATAQDRLLAQLGELTPLHIRPPPPPQVERTFQEATAQDRLLTQLGELTPRLMDEGNGLVASWVEHEERAG